MFRGEKKNTSFRKSRFILPDATGGLRGGWRGEGRRARAVYRRIETRVLKPIVCLVAIEARRLPYSYPSLHPPHRARFGSVMSRRLRAESSVQVNHGSIQHRTPPPGLRKTLIWSGNISPRIKEGVGSGGAFYCFTSSCFICRIPVCVCECLRPPIESVRTCLCVHSLASAADNANPVYPPSPAPPPPPPLSVRYFKYTFLDFKAYPRRRTAAPAPAIQHTHTQNKAPPTPPLHLGFPL